MGEMAREKGVSVAQLLLRWGVQQGIREISPVFSNSFEAVLPKASQQCHIRENSTVFDFQLEEKEMEKLTAMNRDHHFAWNPNGIP